MNQPCSDEERPEIVRCNPIREVCRLKLCPTVNRYTLNQQMSKPGMLVFESEQFENFDNKWRAKERYEIASTDEFVEIFELAPPGKPFAVYSRNHFKRVRK